MARRRRRRPARSKRATEIRDILNEGVALQVELLSAAVQVWSTMFNSLAAYSKVSSQELLKFTESGDANAALDNVIKAGRAKLNKLTELPEEIGKGFGGRVRARAKG
jgi:hypothetical protein